MIKAIKLVGSCVNQENLLTKKDMYNIYSKKRSIILIPDSWKLKQN